MLLLLLLLLFPILLAFVFFYHVFFFFFFFIGTVFCTLTFVPNRSRGHYASCYQKRRYPDFLFFFFFGLGRLLGDQIPGGFSCFLVSWLFRMGKNRCCSFCYAFFKVFFFFCDLSWQIHISDFFFFSRFPLFILNNVQPVFFFFSLGL